MSLIDKINSAEKINSKAVFKIGCLSLVVLVIVGIVIAALTEKDDSDIDKMIASRQFDKARAVVSGEAYVGGSEDAKEQALFRINKAQLGLMIADGDYEDARMLAKELNAQNAFQALIIDDLDKLLYRKDYETVMMTLSTWKFDKVFSEDSYYTNEKYNKEISEYNNIVDAVLQHAIIENNAGLAKKCLALYKPEAVDSGKKDSRGYRLYTLQDNARKRAEKKLKENKIRY